MNRPAATPRDIAWWAGICGLFGALAWIVGDVLIVGRQVDPDSYPLLFSTLADRVETDTALHLVGAPTSILATGALFGTLSIPLYLFAVLHLWPPLRQAGRFWAVPAIVLIFLGFAWSPLGHAGFYYVGAAYQALLSAPPEAHAVLLDMADEFFRVLSLAWYPAVLASGLGMLWFSCAIASGRTGWPRWMAITTNPLVLSLLVWAVSWSLPAPACHWLRAATFNIVWLLVFAQTLVFGTRKPGTPG